MNVETNYLDDYLRDNAQDIISILENTGFYSISFFDRNNMIRCAWHEGGNPTSVCINVSNLLVSAYNIGFNGNLFSLISKHNDLNMFQVYSLCYKILNINDKDFNYSSIFGGTYKRYVFHSNTSNLDEKTYDNKLLDNYLDLPNLRFLKDNISFSTQKKFNIRYDNINNRIIVPWFDEKGDLKGITGRYNFNELGEHPKWKAMENFSKGKMLYGLYQNKEDIIKANYVIIGESEKFVMQLNTYGYHNALALGGCNITSYQSQLIKSLPINKIILAFDEGLSLEHMLIQAEKLKGGIFNKNKEVYCIYNDDNSILPKDSKMAPSDLGKENFEILLNKYCFKKE